MVFEYQHSGSTAVDEAESLLVKTKVVPIYDGSGGSQVIYDKKDTIKEPPSKLFLFVTSWVLFVEGIGGISGLAVSYFYKNTLHASPALLSSVGSISTIPWSMKPVIGFISDGFPIFGYRRKPYIFIGGAIAGVSWLAISLLVFNAWVGCLFLLTSSLGICFGNVISEALIVQKSRGESQEFASKLQSTIWGAQAVGSVIAAWTGGWLLTLITDRQVFLIAAAFPLTLCLLAFFIPDEKVSHTDPEVSSSFKEKFRVLFEAVSKPEIAYPCAFIFMLNATPATGSAWFFFYTDTLHFDSEFMGTINLVGSMCTLGGVVLFQNFLNNKPFRSILFWSTIISSVLGLSQLILIFRWNVNLGIPDGAFCIGESAILSIIGWINTMPILVLAARLCPKGIEGTMYAFIMSVNNFGGIVGSQFGAVLTLMLGVSETNMTNFWLLVLICNLSTLLPLFFIHWIPKEDPHSITEHKTMAITDQHGNVTYQDL